MATPTTLSVSLATLEHTSTTFIYLTVEFTAWGYLRDPLGVSGKTVSVRYNGTSLGSAVTDSVGRYELTGLTIDPPVAAGNYTVTAEFAGDATYDPSSGTHLMQLRKIPTSLTATIPSDFPEDQYCIFQGYLTIDLENYEFDGYPLEGKTIDLEIHTVEVDTDTTDEQGYFRIPWLFPDDGLYTIRLEFDGDDTYDDSYEKATGSDELEIWNHRYPIPEDADENCYGWLLCIDPNAIRGGPIYYLLDTARVKPGLTNKSGSFTATLNDNTKEFDDGFIQYDMYLLGDPILDPNRPFILDQDEYWIGLQRGPVNKADDPSTYTWDPAGGSDGKGAGVHWLMGGYISKRYYSRAEKARVTAHIGGRDYMDVWKDCLFGTDDVPRLYDDPTSIDLIASDVLTDVNAQQEAEYKYTAHPDYWGTLTTTLRINASYFDTILEVTSVTGFSDGDIIRIQDADSPEGEELQILTINVGLKQFNLASFIQNLNGYDKATATVTLAEGILNPDDEEQIEYIEDSPFDVMQTFCDEAIMEWKIDYLKRVMLYKKDDPPRATDESIRYEGNIREVSQIMLGDTDEVITDAVVKDGLPYTVPQDISTWCSASAIWEEISDYGMIIYNPGRQPYPPNPIDQTYTDSMLTTDDQGAVAVCFQYTGDQIQFLIHQGWYLPLGPGTTENDTRGIQLGIDLRTYRRLKFKWRHLTRDLSTPGDPVYIIELHAPGESGGFNSLFRYRFGVGTQEDAGLSNNDTIDSAGWHYIDLLLPEPNVDGTIDLGDTHGKMNEWEATVSDGPLDPTAIDWVSFSVDLDESNPGYVKTLGEPLAVAASIGDTYIVVEDIETLAGYSDSYTSRRALVRPIHAIIIEGPKEERIEITVIVPDTAPPNGQGIIRGSLENNFTTAARVYVMAGKTLSLSQLHFERNFSVQGQEIPTLGPRRYRIYDADELKYQSQVDGKLQMALDLDTKARQYVKVRIDGDPEKEVGTRVRTYLDPHHNKIFQNVPMIIDNVDYVLRGVDLEQTLTLTPTASANKPRELNQFNIADTLGYNLKKVARRGIQQWRQTK